MFKVASLLLCLACECDFFLKIYNSHLISDDFVGVATLEEIGTMDPQRKELELWGKGKENKGGQKETKKPGVLFVHFESSDVLTDL